MNLSAKTEYACLALLELAQHYDWGRPVQVRLITERHGIPSPFLVQILQELKRARLVRSTRGAGGGYQLAQPPQDITLADVLDAVEASAEPTSCAGASRRWPQRYWTSATSSPRFAATGSKGITLAELLERAHAGVDPMWYI